MRLAATIPTLGRRLKAVPLRVWVYGGVLAPIILISAFAWVALSYQPSPTDLVISGSPAEMGRRYGRRLALPVRLMQRFYIDKVVCRGDPKLRDACHVKAMDVYRDLAPCYREELDAMSQACGVALPALCYGNFFLDIGHPALGCRSVIVARGECRLHAHNLDWNDLGGAGGVPGVAVVLKTRQMVNASVAGGTLAVM